MKHYILIFALCMFTLPSQAQMADVIGSMAVQGTITKEGYESVAEGQKALNNERFQGDLANLISEAQMMTLSSGGVSKDVLSFHGFKNIDWNITSTGSGFMIEFKNLNTAECLMCKNPQFGFQKVDINNGGNCSKDNNVKMYF